MEKSRLYRTIIHSPTNQVGYAVRVSRGDTPLGATDTTWVSFILRDPKRGDYLLQWHISGRHAGDYFRLKDRQKEVWLQPAGFNEEFKIPQLDIVAFEGVEGGGVIAEAGTVLPK